MAAEGEQEQRFKVQRDALRPCCSVRPTQIELISVDRVVLVGRGGSAYGAPLEMLALETFFPLR